MAEQAPGRRLAVLLSTRTGSIRSGESPHGRQKMRPACCRGPRLPTTLNLSCHHRPCRMSSPQPQPQADKTVRTAAAAAGAATEARATTKATSRWRPRKNDYCLHGRARGDDQQEPLACRVVTVPPSPAAGASTDCWRRRPFRRFLSLPCFPRATGLEPGPLHANARAPRRSCVERAVPPTLAPLSSRCADRHATTIDSSNRSNRSQEAGPKAEVRCCATRRRLHSSRYHQEPNWSRRASVPQQQKPGRQKLPLVGGAKRGLLVEHPHQGRSWATAPLPSTT